LTQWQESTAQLTWFAVSRNDLTPFDEAAIARNGAPKHPRSDKPASVYRFLDAGLVEGARD